MADAKAGRSCWDVLAAAGLPRYGDNGVSRGLMQLLPDEITASVRAAARSGLFSLASLVRAAARSPRRDDLWYWQYMTSAPGYVRQGASMSFAFIDEAYGFASQPGFDLVTGDGDRQPFPAPEADDGPFIVNMRLALSTSSPSAPGRSGHIASGSGYASGGTLQASSPYLPPSWNPAPGTPCKVCRHAACRCTPPPASRPRFSNRGMPGFDGTPLELPGLELPDVMGVLRGFRWWSMTAPDLSKDPSEADEDWYRAPLKGMRDTWLDGENRAKCLAQGLHDESEVPHPDCGCGFWAYWRLQVHDTGGGQLPVCGVVEGYGATEIGEKGFRAAKARIVALHLPFTIQPSGDPDDDPMGLGLPACGPAYRPGPGGTVYGRSNPWWNHPKFTGRVHHMAGYDPDTGQYSDPSGRLVPDPVPELTGEESAGRQAERQANRDRAEAWMAVIGDRLAQMYPSATIYQTRAAMEADYPPDLTYVPDTGTTGSRVT